MTLPVDKVVHLRLDFGWDCCGIIAVFDIFAAQMLYLSIFVFFHTN